MSITPKTMTAASVTRGLSPVVLPGRTSAWSTGATAPAYLGGFTGRFMAAVCPQLVVDNAVRFVGKQPHPPRGVPR